MCILCHFKFTSEEIRSQLEPSLTDPKFEVWNSTSVSHILLSTTGLDGPQAKEISQTLLERYIAWAEVNPNLYSKSSLMETNLGVLKEKLRNAKSTPQPEDWQDRRQQVINEIGNLISTHTHHLCAS